MGARRGSERILDRLRRSSAVRRGVLLLLFIECPLLLLLLLL
jgi:hypothetical protein